MCLYRGHVFFSVHKSELSKLVVAGQVRLDNYKVLELFELYQLITPTWHKGQPAMWETCVRSLVWEDPLEEGLATHSSILAYRIPMDRGI